MRPVVSRDDPQVALADEDPRANGRSQALRDADRKRVEFGAHDTLGRVAACLLLERKDKEYDALVQDVLKFDPKPAVFYFELGDRLEERRRLDEAEKCYKKASEYRPFLALMLAGLVLRFWDLGAKAFHLGDGLEDRIALGEDVIHDGHPKAGLDEALDPVLAAMTLDLLADKEPFQGPAFRGRELWQHVSDQMPYGFSTVDQVAFESDRNFLEQYFKREFDHNPDRNTMGEIQQQQSNWAWSLLARPRRRTWATETQWLPRADGWLRRAGYWHRACSGQKAVGSIPAALGTRCAR